MNSCSCLSKRSKDDKKDDKPASVPNTLKISDSESVENAKNDDAPLDTKITRIQWVFDKFISKATFKLRYFIVLLGIILFGFNIWSIT